MEFELAAWFQSEPDIVLHGTSGPRTVGDARDSREAHPRFIANHAEYRRHSVDAGYRTNVAR